jgi:hypothetical protein
MPKRFFYFSIDFAGDNAISIYALQRRRSIEAREREAIFQGLLKK